MSENHWAGISQVNGGYIVELDGKQYVCVNLNKAIKLIREHMTGAEQEDNSQ